MYTAFLIVAHLVVEIIGNLMTEICNYPILPLGWSRFDMHACGVVKRIPQPDLSQQVGLALFVAQIV